MDVTRWRALSDHLETLEDMTTKAGARYLGRLAGSHPDLAAELKHYRAAETDDLSQLATATQCDRFAEERIGPYHLRAVLGQGGMGTVYLGESEQDGRQVAVKILTLTAGNTEVRERFAIEQTILGRLQHPNIAALYEAGRLINGRPYFVMELVHGQAITRYCDESACTLTERLALFGQVCDAVAYANAQGIVHRDLKPNNILVCRENGQARVKLIDFGIAKDLNSEQNLTLCPYSPGTLRYMSPEQAGGGDTQDARVDVYALGVLLYELLVGEPPLTWSKNAGPLQIYRDICERRPPVPRRLWASLSREQQQQRAANRGVDAASWQRRLHDKVSWIALKALAKNAQQRYLSAAELKSDVVAFCNKQPLQASAPNMTERLRRWWPSRPRRPMRFGSTMGGPATLASRRCM